MRVNFTFTDDQGGKSHEYFDTSGGSSDAIELTVNQMLWKYIFDKYLKCSDKTWHKAKVKVNSITFNEGE